MNNELKNCKNCEESFYKSFKFCPYCGQQSNEKLTVGVLFYNTISNYFSFDARFFKSFLPLLFKPGYLPSKFIEGKRLLYLHPAQMYLFIAVVFFFLFSFVQRRQIQNLDYQLAKTVKQNNNVSISKDAVMTDSLIIIKQKKEKKEDSIARENLRGVLNNSKVFNGFSDKEIDSLVRVNNFRKNGIASFDFNEKKIDSLIAVNESDENIYKEMGLDDDAGFIQKRLYMQALKFYKSRKGGSILKAFYDTIPVAMFFLLPIFALILKVLHRKKENYSHHLVVSFYFFSFLFTVFSLILIVNFIFDLPNWIDFLFVLSTFVYLLITLRRFYSQNWIKSFIKSSIATFLFLSFVAPITVLVLGVFAFLFY